MLDAGSKLGPYEILARIGVGGMGEVYRARDPRLGRDVAIKVLPERHAGSRELLTRFEGEARAVAALSHPNIVALYDFGSEGGVTYAVSELLEGETLRQRLASGPLPERKVREVAAQIARGLAAAHAAGIVHRDLKPENLFLTQGGGVKILDFGLARHDPLGRADGEPHPLTAALPTTPGTVLGTVGYMSPEQVRGETADPRSDIFSLGCVLHEMVTGRPAFSRDTGAETLAAILREEPTPPATTDLQPSPAMESIILHCLEKDREDRFQSSRDLAFDLDSLARTSALTTAEPVPAERHRPRWRWVAAVLAVVAALAAVFLAGRAGSPRQDVRYERVSFGRGWVGTSRFAPDGESILYDAAWDDRPRRVFLKRPEGVEAAPLGPENALLLSVSRTGELAILLEPRITYQLQGSPLTGTLARLPIDGTVPREVMRDVTGADWAPDGAELAVVRADGPRNRLEFPPGHVLFETTGWLSSPRFSPDGELIAVAEFPGHHKGVGSVTVIDREGTTRIRSPADATFVSGLAWRPDGREVWYGGRGGQLKAVGLSGDTRVVARLPGFLSLGDVSPDGRVLLCQSDAHILMAAMEPGLEHPRGLTWLGESVAMDLSADGRKVLFSEALWAYAGSREGNLLAIRGVDGSPVQRLARGFNGAFSPDGRWIAATQAGRVSLLPAGPGQPRQLEAGALQEIGAVAWLPDGDRVVFAGKEADRPQRLYVQPVSGGPPQAISREQAHLGLFLAPSPDGTVVAAQGPAGQTFLFPLSGDEERPFPGLGDGDIPIRWTDDGRGFLFYRAPAGRRYDVYRLDLASGRRERIRTLAPDEPAGVSTNGGVLATGDGERFVFTYAQLLGKLYVVEGLLGPPAVANAS